MPDVAVEARQVAAVLRGLEPERAPGNLHGRGAPVDAEEAPERPRAGFERFPLPAAQAGEHTLDALVLTPEDVVRDHQERPRPARGIQHAEPPERLAIRLPGLDRGGALRSPPLRRAGRDPREDRLPRLFQGPAQRAIDDVPGDVGGRVVDALVVALRGLRLEIVQGSLEDVAEHVDGGAVGEDAGAQVDEGLAERVRDLEAIEPLCEGILVSVVDPAKGGAEATPEGFAAVWVAAGDGARERAPGDQAPALREGCEEDAVEEGLGVVDHLPRREVSVRVSQLGVDPGSQAPVLGVERLGGFLLDLGRRDAHLPAGLAAAAPGASTMARATSSADLARSSATARWAGSVSSAAAARKRVATLFQ